MSKSGRAQSLGLRASGLGATSMKEVRTMRKSMTLVELRRYACGESTNLRSGCFSVCVNHHHLNQARAELESKPVGDDHQAALDDEEDVEKHLEREHRYPTRRPRIPDQGQPVEWVRDP